MEREIERVFWKIAKSVENHQRLEECKFQRVDRLITFPVIRIGLGMGFELYEIDPLHRFFKEDFTVFLFAVLLKCYEKHLHTFYRHMELGFKEAELYHILKNVLEGEGVL